MDIPPYDEFLKQLKVILWLIGTPYGEGKILLRFYIIMSFLIAMVMAEFAYMISNISAESMFEIMNVAPCLANGLLSISKGITIWQKRENYIALSEKLRQLYDCILVDSKKRKIVRHDLILLYMLLRPFFILNILLISVYNFSTLGLMLYQYLTTNEISFMLPFRILVPFSTNSWTPWLLVYSYSVVCGFIAVFFYTSIDGLYFVLTSHVCANFCVVSDAINNLNEDNVYTLNDIVKSHQNILRLGEDLEDIFQMPNLTNILMGSLQICALGFNITVGSWEQIPAYVLFLICVLIQILMVCVFGEHIIRDSTKVSNAAYFCSWYNMNLKDNKTILTIIIRSQKVQQLTAYKFSVICYASFSKIISTSWSYFTILKRVYTPPEGK